ncbi:MAG: serine/threonine-protein kinase, partial [Nannocystaceae bacterium]
MTQPAPSEQPTAGTDTVVERPQGRVAAPDQGAHIGRYLVLEVVGHGGMGVVLSAFDPKLDRKVALKLLHAGTSTDAQARLQREAQALARLSHPNVIRVHDVGVHDGRVFIAMELVTGGTLADWMKAGRRDWREVSRVFELAARGLAAAHEAGLVHRDFKPSNVLMGDDGQVKVTDFGLARAQVDVASAEQDLPTDDDLTPLPPAALQATLTRTGALVGTPAYMAPEQLDGRPADPRSDQFSFCVALYEALAGRRPFAGSTPWAIAASIEGQRFSTPLPSTAPRSLRHAVRRGLRVDPQLRHPDMPSLLAALHRSRSARTRQVAWVLAAATAGGGVWWASQPLPEAAAGGYCDRVGERLVGVWDDPRRAEVKQAFEATGRAYAQDSWLRVRDELDAQSTAWVDAQRSACEAQAQLPAGARDEGIDRTMVCLHRRLAEMRELGELLAAADADLVERAPRALDALGPIDACRQAGPPMGDDEATALAHAEALAQIGVRSEAGQYDAAVQAADAAVEAASTGSRAMQAEAILA